MLQTTGLVGLAVEPHPHRKLKILYESILKVVLTMPPTAGYRKYTEENIKLRLDAVNTVCLTLLYVYKYIVHLDLFITVLFNLFGTTEVLTQFC